MSHAQAEFPQENRPGHAPVQVPTSGVEDAGPHVWVVVDRRPGPDGRELSTPVVAFSALRSALRFMAESTHSMLLVRVPLVSGGRVETASLDLERDQEI